jgi:hypothetical protein
MSDAQYRFLPWVRSGLATGIAKGAPAGGARATFDVTLAIDGGVGSGGTVKKSARLYGPADAVGLDVRQVIRTDPPPGSTTFESNYLAAIEFDAPELPWLLSPEMTPRPDIEKDRLQPWICLAVVRRDKGNVVADAKPLPRLEFTGDATGELPTLDQAALWAHAQVAGADQSVTTLLTVDPALNLSRLLCPRRLDPGVAYVACVVPTYLAGVQAGLGQPVTATGEPAWTAPPKELPVYFWWEFTTSAVEDFEALARRPEPRPLGNRVGLRAMDVRAPGGGLPSPTASGILDLEGALRADELAPAPWTQAEQAAWNTALRPRLTAQPGGPQVVTPPVYGGAQVGASGPIVSWPEWLTDLNSDPSTRAAAGLGARVVQDQQEQLVASAWEQADALERANQVLRQAQLGQAVARKIYVKRLQPMAPASLFHVTAPAHGRVRADGVTVERKVVDSAFPESAATTAFRKAVRPEGPLGRQIGGGDALPVVVGQLAAGAVRLPILARPLGTVTLEDVPGGVKLDNARAELFDRTGYGWKKLDDVFESRLAVRATVEPRALARAALRRPDDDPETTDPRDTDGIEETDAYRRTRLANVRFRFRTAAQPLQAHLLTPPPQPTIGQPPDLDLARVKTALAPTDGSAGALDPRETVPDRIRPLVPAADKFLRPLLPLPQFAQPMMLPLRDLGQEFLLPGLGDVPPETVGLLEGNARFIEAYMVGLNTAFAQEFLFRGYSTAPDATFFDRFWDGRASVAGMRGSDAGPDIAPIATWDRTKPLGGHARGVGGTGMTVVLVRGEIVRRHPQLTVYLAKEAPVGSGTITPQLYPDFRGVLEPDALYLGFAASIDDLRRPESGWLVVLEEHATAPRFGLDEQRLKADKKTIDWAGTPATWDDLAWTDLATSQAELAKLTHIPLTRTIAPLQPEGTTWAFNGAHMAAITYQRPVRVALAAAEMLRQP